MASLLILKRRIKTAQNISKTTKAFQMIAASRLKKAQEAALSARPYVQKLTDISVSISDIVSEENLVEYMKFNENKRNLVILISPDKGLCGALVTNLAKEAINFYRENKDTDFITVGKKAESIVRIMGGTTLASFDFGTTLPQYSAIYPIMKLIDDNFLSKKYGKVFMIHSNFNSLFSQSPRTHMLLPVHFEKTDDKVEVMTETLFEPSVNELLPGLIRHYLEMNLFHTLLESYLSEQAARMLAMQNATDNAKEIIQDLKLLYNKTRQEKITGEILDIAGGVFANA